MKLPWKTATRALLFSTLLGAGAPALGAESAAPAVEIKIGTILASNQSDEFDGRLAPLEKQLKVMKYRSYRLVGEEAQNVPWKGKAVFEIPGGRALTVTPEAFRNRQIALKVSLTEGQKRLLDTTVRLQNKGNFLLGGPPHEGGALVISIWATVP
ncbi:MAG TPA: hypothetical protein VNN77_13205 [candidate division Zixibacteria bacterium]|nr:hypothetical protein [candidate division Zixibacteria bacterium]